MTEIIKEEQSWYVGLMSATDENALDCTVWIIIGSGGDQVCWIQEIFFDKKKAETELLRINNLITCFKNAGGLMKHAIGDNIVEQLKWTKENAWRLNTGIYFTLTEHKVTV